MGAIGFPQLQAAMLAPQLQFMVHSSEVIDDEGYAHRGSSVALLESGMREPPQPQWRTRDFAFAAYGGCHAQGLREVRLGKWTIWAFAAAREHCEEVVVFRKGADTRRKWNEDATDDPKIGMGMFFIMLADQITAETPLGQQFNGEWGFWESFFVPLIEESHTMQSLGLMDPAMVEDHFAFRRLPVTCHKCPDGERVLTIPSGTVVTYEVKIVCKEMREWSDLCNKIGEDMTMEDFCIVEHKHLKPGDECIDAYHEHQGIDERARLIKRDFEQLKLPVVLTFKVTLKVKEEWQQDMISLQYKYDFMSQIYTTNMMGGFTSLSGARSDPWSPVARLAVNALTKLLSKFPEINNVMDVGCGDMAWVRYFLKGHPSLAYVGVDINAFCIALNAKRFPRLQFVQTDLSNSSGIEVMPQGCDLVIAKDVFNHMTLPDAVAALRRIVCTKPRFLLANVHTAADNTGWERRVDKHLHYTRYDYSKPPFSLPFPATLLQPMSDEACLVLYEISPAGSVPAPPRTARLRPPAVGAHCDFSLLAAGTWQEPEATRAVSSTARAAPPALPPVASATAAGERTKLTVPVTELPDRIDERIAAPERNPIKGLPPLEFRARCDLIFDRFDVSESGFLRFAEVAALMTAGGRNVETQDAYESLCSRMGCTSAAGLERKDVYRFFEKAPQPLWDQVYRSIDPLAGLVCRGAEVVPPAFLEKPLCEFLFEDGDEIAQVHVELNAHMFYGAAEAVTDACIRAFFGVSRMEVHIYAPAMFGGKDIHKWKLVVPALSGEVVPEDCRVELKETTGRFGSKRLTVSLMKAKRKKWYKIGQVGTAARH